MMIKDYEARKRIGERIRQLRKERGMSQTELAEKAGLVQPHIVRIEQGRYSVGLDTLQAIAKALGCTVDMVEQIRQEALQNYGGKEVTEIKVL